MGLNILHFHGEMGTLNNCVMFLLVYHGFHASQGFDCNFDNDWCAWKQDIISDNFNWTRHQGQTGSSYTGPEFDHTSTNGYYIYIEAGPPRNSGDRARMISPLREPGSYCLIFWYSMYGQNIDTLNVYMRISSRNDTLIFSREGNTKSAEWQKGVVSMNTKAKYQVVLEGIAGGAKGDVAVDDVSLISGMCSVDCEFELDFCNWVQDSDDNFDWTRILGSTRTFGNVPTTDHTTGDGLYIYIEATYPRVNGDKARLISPVQQPGLYCLTFWYFMYGTHNNRLNVHMKVDGSNETLLFSRENDTEDFKWKEAIFNYTATDSYQIVLEGIRGNGNQGDIAVDDISLTLGPCTTVSTSTTKVQLSSESQTFEESSNTTVTSTITKEQTVQTTMNSTGTKVSEQGILNTLTSQINTHTADSSVDTTVEKTTLVTKTNTLTMSTQTISSSATTATSTQTSLVEISSRHTSLTKSSTLTQQTNTQEQSSIEVTTKQTGQTIQFTTPTSIQTSKNAKSSLASSHNYHSDATMDTATKTSVSSKEKAPSSYLITSSTLPSSPTTPNTQLHPTIIDTNVGSMTAVYASFIAVTATLLVLVIVLYIFVCRRRRQEILSISTDSRSVQTNEDAGFVMINHAYIDDVFDNKSDSNFRTNNPRLCQDQYSEVSLDQLQLRDAKDSDCAATASVHNTIEEENHIYSHIQTEGNTLIDSTYSRVSEFNGNRTLRSIETNCDTGTLPQDDCDADLDIMYDHITSGGKSKKTSLREEDQYSHLSQIASTCTCTKKISDNSYGYASVLKKMNNSDSVLEFSESRESSNFRGSYTAEEQNESENNSYCHKFVMKDESDYTESKEDTYHDYFVLEKVDNGSFHISQL